MEHQDVQFMRQALDLARAAVAHGNEPFGALLVKDGAVVMTNENQIHSASDPTYHAEHGLLRNYCHQAGVMDLSACTLYTSCEPCFMCSGAMVWAKLGRLVFSAYAKDLDQLLGEAGQEPSRLVFDRSCWAPSVTGGVLRAEGVALLAGYFG